MRIIEINSLDNGAHRNQSGSFNTIPVGWAMIPDNMETQNFPFGEVEAEEIDGVMIVTKWTPVALPEPDIKVYQLEKEAEISKSCNTAIISGIDVATTHGIEHFSLEETDQINLTTAFNTIQQGATMYPYHSDGNMCRMFTADEIMAISNASIHHKLYHTTLCNHLLTWVRRTRTVEEINSITYSADNLPEDLAANMASILTASASI
jgi:hypothetical protein